MRTARKAGPLSIVTEQGGECQCWGSGKHLKADGQLT